jgi:cytochrome c peroxidase
VSYRKPIKFIGSWACWVATAFFLSTPASSVERPNDSLILALGQALFVEKGLSSDGTTSCSSCHVPSHAYADPRALSIGVNGRLGTRNAPSLVGIGADTSYFWDGRRSQLEDAVLDPVTNPVELGFGSRDELVLKLNSAPVWKRRFAEVFGISTEISVQQLQMALVTFVRSLHSQGVPRRGKKIPGSAEIELGRNLFTGIAGCSECHSLSNGRFSDEKFHHSGVEQSNRENLPAVASEIVRENLDINLLGPKVLANANWSSMGRFVVSHQPSDIGAFRTPSLVNVAFTAPYMHDGSIATLAAAVDREIYYRAFSTGVSINLTSTERRALVAFLQSLLD